ncbi:hypothetical protein Q5424_00860 [Conexibacter sp. JD483]|uniref:hypothetical protein n=1 Tax=unclassified Conexibacter TaxID=2627773 RepID=UPI002717BCDF|nr:MULTISPECIES: hypothetical protein [unclassified Conexibacter]MDO8189038.1 hypothetical protein [Conexibacter sp. CPCC 205706]MDO8198521.1 hypothetical protein [Conexibacter sp. CPCC 205762]MDR9367607.1 hypothetical protein [Conexibacter sp. JD483]
MHIAIGYAERPRAFGRKRKYRILFLGPSSPVRPLVEFLEVDDHDRTGDLIAVIRGSDGAKKMYDPSAALPPAYDQVGGSIVVFRDRVPQRYAWTKLALVAHEGDVATQLNHALLQARRRGDLPPSGRRE